MHPTRAASILALIGAVLLSAALALRLLSLAQALAAPPGSDSGAGEQALPAIGAYRLSADGKQLFFQQSPLTSPLTAPIWYSVPVDGGLPVRAEPPEEGSMIPFRISQGAVFLQAGDSDTQVMVSPQGEQVLQTALSPDGSRLAFSTRRADGRWRLYLVAKDGRLAWLGEENAAIDLDWSPDGKALAFVAPRNGVDQVFRASADGQSYRQLTSDPARKSSPRWSPDGAWIGYLATTARYYPPTIGRATPSPEPLLVLPTPTPASWQTGIVAPVTDVYLVPSAGGEPIAVTTTPEEEHGLLWANSSRGAELLYAVRQPLAPHASFLEGAAVVTSAGGSPAASVRKVYPPVTVEGIECPPSIPAGETGTVRLALRSTALVPIDLPVTLAAGGQPLLAVPGLGSPASRRETLTLLPGETRLLEWQAPSAAGRFTRITAQAQVSELYPIASPHCSALNTWMGVPNLPFLPISLPLAALGLPLCVPRLLQLRRYDRRAFLRMAALILFDILLLAAVIAQEINLAR